MKFKDKKEVRPAIWCRHADGREEWRLKHLLPPRPIYGLDQLALRPDAPVLVVEGAKKCDPAERRFPEYVAIAWPAGCNSAHLVDWSPLKGREVTIWPDNDEPGRAAAARIAGVALNAGAKSALIVPVPHDFPDKWDLADEPPAGADLTALLAAAHPPGHEEAESLSDGASEGDQGGGIGAGADSRSNNPRPEIQLRPGEISEAVDAAERALIRRGGLYQSGNRIVYLGEEPVITADKNEVTASRIFERGEHALAEDLAEAASFTKYDARAKSIVVVNPPPLIVKTLMERVGRFKIPVLTGVINAPTLRPDGSLLSEPGYDPETGLFFDPRGCEFPAIPRWPSREDAVAALGVIDDLIRHFPFVEDADRSVAISGILTYVARQSMRSAPLHAYTAPTAGSGKSKLVDIASIIATGREAGVIAQTASEEEMEKRIGALLLEGRSSVAIDNCTHPLDGNFLCSMLTQPIVVVRVLGKSKQVTVPTNAFTTATGNNLVISGDTTRRTALCRLDPKMERPELREFNFDPVMRAKENRPKLVAAALTIMLAFKAAGSPQQATPLGSFEDWSSTVRDALIWLGRADPVKTMEYARATDNKLDDLASVLTLWRTTIGPMVRITCRKLIDKASLVNNRELKDALMAIAAEGTATINARRLGKWLGRNAKRRCNGMWLEPAGIESGIALWQLCCADHPTAG
jgi:hypothetical protein